MRQFNRFNGRTRMVLRAWRERTVREKQFLVGEFAQVAGLMPLLMKRRNRQQWTPEDRVQLARHLRRLSHLSPYIAVLVLPGGLLMLPALAWWLDRRRNATRTGAAQH
ncbi:MAG: hypothetical protein ACT4P8_02460 [Betaproteobacteria bacterium]